MKILAIETASPPGSIALLDNDQLVSEATLSNARRTTQDFAPLIQTLLQEAGWEPRDIQAVATTTGPGSFTGLRIGVTAAKVFAYAVGCPTVGVNTLEVIASQSPPTPLPIEAVIDAQRKQLFAARYERQNGTLVCVSSTKILDGQQWLAERASDALLIGPGLKRYTDRITDGTVADQQFWIPRAAMLGHRAHAAVMRGQVIEPLKLVPHYYRRSAAEEKLNPEIVDSPS